jgi:biotin transport system substrate-specific component
MRIREMSRCAVFAALMAVCAWLAIPFGHGAVTMQTAGLFLTLGLLGGRRGSVSVLLYLCLGVLGLPVFAGFQGGFGVILGPTGGFLWGFLVAAGVSCLCEKHLPLWCNLVLCQLIIYICGTCWYYFAYAQGNLWAVLMTTVLPYLLPDTAKLALSLILIKKLNYRLTD